MSPNSLHLIINYHVSEIGEKKKKKGKKRETNFNIK